MICGLVLLMDLRELAENASCASLVEGLNVSVITKNCKYFYYCCDGTDDRVSSSGISMQCVFGEGAFITYIGNSVLWCSKIQILYIVFDVIIVL